MSRRDRIVLILDSLRDALEDRLSNFDEVDGRSNGFESRLLQYGPLWVAGERSYREAVRCLGVVRERDRDAYRSLSLWYLEKNATTRIVLKRGSGFVGVGRGQTVVAESFTIPTGDDGRADEGFGIVSIKGGVVTQRGIARVIERVPVDQDAVSRGVDLICSLWQGEPFVPRELLELVA